MFGIEWIIVTASIVWAIIALLAQCIQARGKGRRDYSTRAGNVIGGVIYNFTWAMLPRHKEVIRNHPVKFLIGVVMHLGIFIAMFKVLVLLIVPASRPLSPVILGVTLGAASLCGIYLFLRRVFSKGLKSMSSPEDYISILITLGFLLAALGHELGIMNSGAFMIYAAVVFFYLPLGKLKHALFFFVARADYGARLGYRGTYPARGGVKE